MSANYLHGIETLEVERGPRSIRVVKSAVIALVGTAPIGPLNTLVLCQGDIDAAQFGPDLAGFSIPQALSGIYDFGAGTVLVINVLNPATHRSTLVGQECTFTSNDQAQLDHGALQEVALKTSLETRPTSLPLITRWICSPGE